MRLRVWLASVLAGVAWAAGCNFPRPADVVAKDAASNTVDAMDAGVGDVASDVAISHDTGSPSVCSAGQALRCDGGNLVRCNGDGTAEVSEGCTLGCDATVVRCKDVNPSNGLAPFLDMAVGEPDLDLGTAATMNTDDGSVIVDGDSVVVKSTTVVQTSAPTVRVFIVRALTATTVTIKGANAVAIVSNGDIKVGGVFAASADAVVPGPGRFNDGSCKGADSVSLPGATPGGGGGGFGVPGGSGGAAVSDDGSAIGNRGGSATGNPTLIPLRGGCDSGNLGPSAFGAGGGAIQLVSRTKIIVSGVVAANGSSLVGGGSGGGILLEAPVVEVSGAVVANGGAGAGGCVFARTGENGRLDMTPATGGIACNADGGNGGNGGAGNTGAGNGVSVNRAGTGSTRAFGGHGGGSVGRIRVNTISGGLHTTGVFSPNPSTGALSTR